MSIRKENEKNQTEIEPHIAEQIDPLSDKRVKIIYERYKTGKSIIMDDLKYLCLKDPEGCKNLVRSIVESKTVKELEIEPDHIISIGSEKKDTENAAEQQSCIEDQSASEIQMDTLAHVIETMISVKSEIKKMSEWELLDMIKNLNEALELKKMSNTMKYWDDTFTDKMVMYTYSEEKEFNMLT